VSPDQLVVSITVDKLSGATSLAGLSAAWFDELARDGANEGLTQTSCRIPMVTRAT
jgi:hypothetical protein